MELLRLLVWVLKTTASAPPLFNIVIKIKDILLAKQMELFQEMIKRESNTYPISYQDKLFAREPGI